MPFTLPQHPNWLPDIGPNNRFHATQRSIENANTTNNNDSNIYIQSSNLVHCKCWCIHDKSIVQDSLAQWNLKNVIFLNKRSLCTDGHYCPWTWPETNLEILVNWSHSQIIINWNVDKCSHKTRQNIYKCNPCKCTSINIIFRWRSHHCNSWDGSGC